MFDIYMIIFCISAGFLLIQLLCSLISGFDLDFDFNLGEDFDDVISFKGLTHFSFGYSTTIILMGNTLWIQLFAIFVGFLFVFVLAKLYKLIMNLEQVASTIDDISLVGCSGIIIVKLNDNSYLMNVSTPLGVKEIIVISKSNNPDLKGKTMQIIEVVNNQYLIN